MDGAFDRTSLKPFGAEDSSSGLARFFLSNSTSAVTIIAIGASLVVLTLVGLYLYDYFFTPAAAKADQYYNPNTDPNYQYYQPPQARRYTHNIFCVL